MNDGYQQACNSKAIAQCPETHLYAILSSSLPAALAAYPLSSTAWIPTTGTQVVTPNMVTVDFGAKSPASTGSFLCPPAMSADSTACSVTVTLAVNSSFSPDRPTLCLRLIDTTGWYQDAPTRLSYVVGSYNATTGTLR